MNKKFAFYDGDNVGGIIEQFLHTGKIKEAQQLSQNLIDFFEFICEKLGDLKGIEIIICGGDDLLFSFDSNEYATEFFEQIRVDFKAKTQTTISCGIGETIQESIFCLYLAKLYGKNKLIENRK